MFKKKTVHTDWPPGLNWRELYYFSATIAVYSKIIIKWNELQSIINSIQSNVCVEWIKKSVLLSSRAFINLVESKRLFFLFCFLIDHYVNVKPYTRETQTLVTNLFVEDTTEQWKNIYFIIHSLSWITIDFAALIVSWKTAVFHVWTVKSCIFT